MKELEAKVIDRKKQEFTDTRSFLRSVMVGIIQGEVNHQQASDIATLAHVQNQSLALEATLFPDNARNIKGEDILKSANRLIIGNE